MFLLLRTCCLSCDRSTNILFPHKHIKLLPRRMRCGDIQVCCMNSSWQDPPQLNLGQTPWGVLEGLETTIQEISLAREVLLLRAGMQQSHDFCFGRRGPWVQADLPLNSLEDAIPSPQAQNTLDELSAESELSRHKL